MTPGCHGVEALLGAYFDAIDARLYGNQAHQRWHDHLLSVHCRCFGVSFDERKVPPEKCDLLIQLKRLLRHEAQLPYPERGALEGSLLSMVCPPERSSLIARRHDLAAFYRGVALELAAALWGDLGNRTDEQLEAAHLVLYDP